MLQARLSRTVACCHQPAALSLVPPSSRCLRAPQPCRTSCSDEPSTSGREEITSAASGQHLDILHAVTRYIPSDTFPSTSVASWTSTDPTLTVGAVALLITSLGMLLPGIADASGGSFSGQSLEMFQKFLEEVEALGPWGAVLFVVVVMLFEMVPLFPTQPLSLASGLLFGAGKGAVLMLIGVTLAALNAFLLARGVGRPLAQKVIDAEMSHTSSGSDSEGEGMPAAHSGNAVASKLAEVQAVIENGGMLQQLTAIALLRLTPVVPFSASNYLLGLTPVALPAYVGGTIIGMSVWATLYASLGGASRALLDKGANISTLLADLAGKASAMSASAVQISVGVAAVGAAAFAVNALVNRGSQTESNGNGVSARHGASGPASTSPSRATVSGRTIGMGSFLNNDGASDSQDLPRPLSEITSSMSPGELNSDDEEAAPVQAGSGNRKRAASRKVRAASNSN